MEEHEIKEGDKFIMPYWEDCIRYDGRIGYAFGGLDKGGIEVKVVGIAMSSVAVSPVKYTQTSFTYNMEKREMLVGNTVNKEEYSLTF